MSGEQGAAAADASSAPDSRVGVIGLGTIGGGVARSLARAGRSAVIAHDADAAATARLSGLVEAVESAAEVAARCGVVLVAVVDDAQVREVVTGSRGVLEAAAPGTIVVVLSTVAPSTVEALADAGAARGVHLVDCGVSGGPSAAANGQLVCMLGGAEEDVETARPVLEDFSSAIFHTGRLGTGLVTKLARNVVQYGAWAAAYEGQRLAEAAGVELGVLGEAVRAAEAQSGATTALMFRDTVAPLDERQDRALIGPMRGAARLAHKDLQAALEVGRGLGVELPLSALTDDRIDLAFGLDERGTASPRGSRS